MGYLIHPFLCHLQILALLHVIRSFVADVHHSVHSSEHESFDQFAHFLGKFGGSEYRSQHHYGYVVT
ncbi:hypothetical protein JHK82_043038 [Glycine max]|nr:hypothetical protein JHK82_043038 [Glycine max]